MSPEELAEVPADTLSPTVVAEAVVRLVLDTESGGRVVELRCVEVPRSTDAGRMRGVLIGESLRVGTCLDGVALVVDKICRIEAGDPEAGQPGTWTLVHFQAPAERAEHLADVLSRILDRQGGWYCDFHSESESFVVFSDRVFRYPRRSSGGASRR